MNGPALGIGLGQGRPHEANGRGLEIGLPSPAR